MGLAELLGVVHILLVIAPASDIRDFSNFGKSKKIQIIQFNDLFACKNLCSSINNV